MDRAGGDDGSDAGEDGDPASPASLAREYYRALDEGDYDSLAGALAADFVHERPDRTLDGRERFVRFMREERPQTDTSHPIDGVYRAAGGTDGGAGGDGRPDGVGGSDGEGVSDGTERTEVVVRGRLLAADGSEITAFVDVFRVGDGVLRGLRTFTH